MRLANSHARRLPIDSGTFHRSLASIDEPAVARLFEQPEQVSITVRVPLIIEFYLTQEFGIEFRVDFH